MDAHGHTEIPVVDKYTAAAGAHIELLYALITAEIRDPDNLSEAVHTLHLLDVTVREIAEQRGRPKQ